MPLAIKWIKNNTSAGKKFFMLVHGYVFHGLQIRKISQKNLSISTTQVVQRYWAGTGSIT